MSQQVKPVTFGTAQHSILLVAMSAFLFPKGFMCISVCIWVPGFRALSCVYYILILYDVCLYVCLLIPGGKFYEVKLVMTTWQNSISGAVFCSRALQHNRCLLSHRLKPWPSGTCTTTVTCLPCMCVLQAAYTPVLYTHPHPLQLLYTTSPAEFSHWQQRLPCGAA